MLFVKSENNLRRPKTWAPQSFSKSLSTANDPRSTHIRPHGEPSVQEPILRHSEAASPSVPPPIRTCVHSSDSIHLPMRMPVPAVLDGARQ